MWKKGLENVLSHGMAGLRNGNYSAFYTVFGKGNKKKKTKNKNQPTNIISVGQHSVPELKGALKGEKSDRSY